MQTQTEQADIKAKIADLRARYMQLARSCSYGARINSSTVVEYTKQLQALEAQLN